MGSNRPAAPGRLSRLTRLLVVLSAAACAVRPPILVPPPSGIDGVEGFGSASIAGAEASIKGMFAFLFRRPGLGRVEAVDPIGRTAFVIHFRDRRAWFVLPRKKVYTEDEAEVQLGTQQADFEKGIENLSPRLFFNKRVERALNYSIGNRHYCGGKFV